MFLPADKAWDLYGTDITKHGDREDTRWKRSIKANGTPRDWGRKKRSVETGYDGTPRDWGRKKRSVETGYAGTPRA